MSRPHTKRTTELLNSVRGSLMSYYPLIPIVVTRAKGCFVTDADGKRRIDAIAGYGANIFGHAHPALMELCRSYFSPAPDGTYFPALVPNAMPTTPLGPTAKALSKILSKEFAAIGKETEWKLLFSNGGVEAVEAAIKLARKWGQKHDRSVILTAEGNFHGRTTTVVGFSSEPAYRDPFGPYHTTAFRSYPYDDIPALEKILKNDWDFERSIAAILIEPIQGEGGVRIPEPGYLAQVRALCDQYGILLIADEIQTGFWRTGTFLASLQDGIVPDIVIMGKALGAGITPVSAVAALPHCALFTPGEHGSTYGGNAFAMTIAGRVIELCEEEDLRVQVPKMGDYLRHEIMTRLVYGKGTHLVKDIRGKGLMVGVELFDPDLAKEVIGALLDHSVLTKDAHGVIRITPPLIIKRHECMMLAKYIAEAFTAVAKNTVK